MPPPENLKGRTIVGGPNCPTQRISGLLEKILTLMIGILLENYHPMLIIPEY